MDITSLIESAKQLSRQYERNAMSSEIVIEKISMFNHDAMALGRSQTRQNDASSQSTNGDDSVIDEIEKNLDNYPTTMKRTRNALLRAVQSDSNQLRLLYEENLALKEELSEYQFGLELIMSKYRANILDCLNDAERLFNLEQPALDFASRDSDLKNEIISLTDQVETMRNMLAEQVISSNIDILNRQTSELHRLKIEFDSLRGLCEISRNFGADPLNKESWRTDSPDTVIEK